MQSRRNKRAALRLMRKLIRKYRMVPSTFVTDRLPSYAAARAELPLPIAHERGLRQNNRAESSHVPVRRRERKRGTPLWLTKGLCHVQPLLWDPGVHEVDETSVVRRLSFPT